MGQGVRVRGGMTTALQWIGVENYNTVDIAAGPKEIVKLLLLSN